MSAPSQAQSAASAAQTQEGVSLEDQVIQATKPQSAEEAERAKEYFDEFLKQAVKAGGAVSNDVERTINYWIARIDEKLSAQLNEIMHHPDFQKVEGTWRGLEYLIKNSEVGEKLELRVLNATKKDLLKDFDRAADFDRSVLFDLVYTKEYGTLGGFPYGMLVGDFEFGRHPEDISLLTKLSGVAAAAHAPFIAASSPKLFNMDSFTQLNGVLDIASIFQGVEYAQWKSFRESEDSRYVALTMPRVLARLPYGKETKPVEEFNYEEDVDGKDHHKYLWMNSAWAYAARITDAMAKYGWPLKSRGVEAGGKVEGLPAHVFQTMEGDIALKCPTEIAIPDSRELELSNQGFLPLVHCKDRDFAVFMGAQSCQKPKQYFDADANASAELSAKINYIMCVSRFAHYFKVIVRDKIGGFAEAADLQRYLNKWINNYVLANPEQVDEDARARQPLRAAQVSVQEIKGRPGWYEAVAHLRPHFQLEGVNASFRLVANVPQKKS